MGNAIGIMCLYGCDCFLEVEDGEEDHYPKPPLLLAVWEALKCPKCGSTFYAEYAIRRNNPL